MKGIVLAGGTATRLFPLTIVTNKHLLPIYDRPMIYYPIETLAGMGIREVMVIVGGKSVGDVVELLGDGSHFGLDLTYRYQAGAYGIAQAIGLARGFVGADAFCCVLGDNILRGPALADVAADFEASGRPTTGAADHWAGPARRGSRGRRRRPRSGRRGGSCRG
jgi:glucose-1-phosphate thymidylyltransferase